MITFEAQPHRAFKPLAAIGIIAMGRLIWRKMALLLRNHPLSEEGMNKETVVYKTVSNLDIRLDVYTPQGLPEESPTLLWIHGGAMIGGSRGDDRTVQFRRYFDAGYRMISIDYRLAPETKLPGIIADVRDAVDWIYDRGWNRLGAIGHSAGGYLALMTGAFPNRPQAIVSFYGYGNFVGDWLSKPDPFYCAKPKVTK